MKEFQPLQYYWNLRVHDSEFLQLRAISAAQTLFVWVCLERMRRKTQAELEERKNQCGDIVQINVSLPHNLTKAMFEIAHYHTTLPFLQYSFLH